jgi:hypothetical protein
MFSRTDFEAWQTLQESHLSTSEYYGLYYTEYPQFAFRSHFSEESIRITRAPKTPGDNGLRFWLAAELADDWRGRESYFKSYVSGAAFEPVTESFFNDLVAGHCMGLVVPPPMPLASGAMFQGGLLMYEFSAELIVSAFAEYENEFVHFAWSSTA